MKWITANDLNNWVKTQSKDAQQFMPELVEKLIYAIVKNHHSITQMRIPVGDKTYLHGYDGVVDSSEIIYFVGAGISVWEIGTNDDPKAKAEQDFNNRIKKEGWIDKKKAIFVFVTPLTWNGAIEWADEKRKLGIWKYVCVFTDVELEHWLEQCPSVALWLASKLKRIDGGNVFDIETYWKNWSSQGSITIPLKMLLGGRDNEVAKIGQAFDFEHPKTILISSLSNNESLAFAVAACLDNKEVENASSKTVVVTSDDMLRRIIDEYEGLVIIADVNRQSYNYATKRKHSIIYSSGPDNIQGFPDSITLSRVDREAFVEGSMEMGLSEIDARMLMLNSMRDIMVVRRQFWFDLTPPDWAQDEDLPVLTAMFLIGKWRADRDGDKQAVEKVAGSYDDLQKKANVLKNKDDAPIINIDNVWRLKSAYDVFSVLAQYISTDQLDKYREVTTECLLEIDPNAKEKATTNVEFNVWQEKRIYSMWLKEGLLQTAIIIALRGKDFSLPIGYDQLWIDGILNEVYAKADVAWWLSNQHLITAMAEASPEAFLKTLDEGTKGGHQPLKALFEKKSTNIFSSNIHYSEILWALESLAWDKTYLPRVTDLLFRFTDYNTDDGYDNKPINSLGEIYKIWHPQTYASDEVKKKVLKAMSKKYPQKIFDFCFRQVNIELHHVAMSTEHFKWRYFQNNQDCKSIQMITIINSEQFLVDLMLEISEDSETDIATLIKVATNANLPFEIRKKVQAYIDSVKEKMQGNLNICDALREELRFNYSMSDSISILTVAEMEWLKQLLAYIEPKDVAGRNAWLFSSVSARGVLLSQEDTGEEQDAELQQLRLEAISQFDSDGAIFAYSKKVKEPATLGNTYCSKHSTADSFRKVLQAMKKKTIDEKFAYGFFIEWLRMKGVNSLIAEVDTHKNDFTDEIILPLHYASWSIEAITYVDKLNDEQQQAFWTLTNIYDINSEMVIHALEKLLQYKQYNNAMVLCYLRCKSVMISANLLQQVMEYWMKSDSILRNHSHEVAKLIEYIDGREDVPQEAKLTYEFYLHDWIKGYPTGHQLTFNRLMESDGEFMYSLLKRFYGIKNSGNADSIRILGDIISYNLPSCPYTSAEGMVEEASLNNYINILCTNAKRDGISKKVEYFIGRLLAQSVRKDFVPEAICKIVDHLDSSNLNQSFETQMFNNGGFSSRSPFEGGTVERAKIQHFKKIADDIRIEYPVTASIFDNLCHQYERDAQRMDREAEITDIESL